MGAGALVGIGSAIGLGASYMGYRNTTSSANQQAGLAMQTSRLQQQQFLMQSAFQAQQAGALMGMSGAYMKQADAFIQQSAIAARTGELLQANERFKATQAQREAEEQTRKAAEMRRLLIGDGRTKFAANGVLLEGRPQSAVAMWEQDEIADLAFEMDGIKRAVDNEVWAYEWNGSQARLQGLFNARALELQAEGSKIEAGNASINASGAMAQSQISAINAQTALLQGQSAVAQANATSDAALWNFIGSIAGIGMTAGTMISGMGGGGGGGGGSGNAGGYGDYSLLRS